MIKGFKKLAFTLAEVIIVLGIIGIIAELTIPGLVQSSQEAQMVAGLLKFHSTLQQSIQQWKNDTQCYSDSYSCLLAQGADNDTFAEYVGFFENVLAKNMKIIKKRYFNEPAADWLPSCTKDYAGTCTAATITGEVSNNSTGTIAYYLLADGTTFGIMTSSGTEYYEFFVDVNGKKGPNRIGKDTYRMRVGSVGGASKEISYCKATGSGASGNATGLCSCAAGYCNPNNINPANDNGAMPTTYVLLNKKIPDYY